MSQSIKSNAELRHVLSHLSLAISAIAKGNPNEAVYELEQIEGLLFFETDEEMSAYLRSIDYGDLQQDEKDAQAQEISGRT